jgi:UDP-N-acetylmuramate dehydrogenase
VKEEDKQRIKELCRGTVLRDALLQDFVSFRVGGPADVIALPEDSDDLIALCQHIRQERIPFLLLGEGTNLIVRDGGFRGVVIKLSEGFRVIAVEREEREKVYVSAQAGARLMKLVTFACDQGLTGVEFACGIPGSIGGAVAMNAGAYGKDMKAVIHSILVMNAKGAVEKIGRDQLDFAYRTANLPSHTIVAEALLELKKGSREEIAAEMDACLSKRKERQPLDLPSAGSVFRNPPCLHAAQLIDEVGLKGCQIGGAAVSRRHANFIVNRGNATAADILSLINLIRQRVKQEKGIDLEPEVHVVGEDP